MPFPPGADVVVRAINRRGRVVEVRGNVYRVAVGGLSMTCREHELRRVDATRPAPGTRKTQASAARSGAAGEPRVVRSIDLHGMTVEEARTAVADFLSRAVLDGADTLEIVHGIGTGRVRDAVRRELQQIGAVRAIRPHPTNAGVTIVQL